MSKETLEQISVDELQLAIGNPDNKYPFDYGRTSDKKDVLTIQLIDPKKAAEKVLELIQSKHTAGRLKSIEDGWISVEDFDKLPQGGERVLIITSSGLMEVGYLFKGVWERNWAGKSFKDVGYEITHWQPLPSPPQTQVK